MQLRRVCFHMSFAILPGAFCHVDFYRSYILKLVYKICCIVIASKHVLYKTIFHAGMETCNVFYILQDKNNSLVINFAYIYPRSITLVSSFLSSKRSLLLCVLSIIVILIGYCLFATFETTQVQMDTKAMTYDNIHPHIIGNIYVIARKRFRQKQGVTYFRVSS